MLFGVAGMARELWIERFPNRAIPCARTFTSVVQHLEDHGTFKLQTHDRGRDRTERILQAEEQILERVEEEPDISTRRLAAEVGVSQFVVHRTLKEQDLHPCHVEKVQALEPADFPRHVVCILFTDEARFTRNTIFNSHNTHIWSNENPYARQDVRFQ